VKSFNEFQRFRWKTCVGVTYNTKVTLTELKNDKIEIFQKNNNFGSWFELLGKKIKHIRVGDYQRKEKKRLCKEMVNYVVDEFFSLLLIDILINNDTFVFPGNIAIMRVLKKKYDKVGKPIINDYYTPYVTMRQRTKRRYNLGNLYNFKITERWRSVFQEELKLGHNY